VDVGSDAGAQCMPSHKPDNREERCRSKDIMNRVIFWNKNNTENPYQKDNN